MRKTYRLPACRSAYASLGQIGFKQYVVEQLRVPRKYRWRGHGSALLKAICADADREGVALYLWIAPEGGMVYGELNRWYARHGFKLWLRRGTNCMRRLARRRPHHADQHVQEEPARNLR